MSPISKILLAALAAAVIVGPLAWFAASRRALPIAAPGAEIEQLRADNAELRQRTATLEQESAQLREQLAAQGIKVAPPVSGAPQSSKSDDVQPRLEAVRQLGVLQTRLAAAQTSLAELQSRTQELETTVNTLNSENKRLQGESADLKENLASTTRIVQTMDAELKSKTERLAQLEAAARKQRDDSAVNAQRIQAITAVLRDLEDVNRRRENYITSLQRRYRDLTDQFRATAQRIDAARDNITPLAGDVSRIQSTVQSAEDDLRQLTTLNAQAKSIASKLTK